MMKVYKHLFFDLDRTIYDFEAGSRLTLFDIFEKYNLQSFFENFNHFHALYKKHNDKMWVDYRNKLIEKSTLNWMRFYNSLLEVGVNDEILSRKMAEDYVSTLPNKCVLFPDAIETLEYLQNRYKMYIITNGFKEVQYKKMNNCGLNKYFDKVYISEEIGYNKPEKEYFDAVVFDCGAKIEESLVIGDDPDVDIQGAINANIDSVWFNSNNKESDLYSLYKINSLKQLIEIL